MSKKRSIARRTFLIGSAAIVGGVAFGVYRVRKPHDNPLLANLADGEVTFNPWVKVGRSGITLIAPHTDLGQGIRSLQAALIAEELDVDLDQVEVSAGLPAPAYFNTVALDEGTPFRARDTGFIAEQTRGFLGVVAKLAGIQMTGGSSSTIDSYEKLRLAGAVARETLKLAAAGETGIDVSKLRTQGGAVILPDGTRMRYTTLAAAAANIEPVQNVELRAASQWRLLGKNMMRIDVAPKSTGQLKYGIDLDVDGMLHAAVRFNPRQGGAMLGYDASQAECMPGVVKVLQVSNGIAVIANNTWRAFNAIKAVKIEWGDAPYPPEMGQHWQEVAASFRKDRLDRKWRDEGDIEAALQAQSPALEFEYRAPYLAHAPLEPLSALALLVDGRADLWVSHQIPRFAQDIVAEITGLSADNVFLHNQYCGGSFGHRLEFENIRYVAEIAAQMPGTPIKLTFSREEDFAHDFVRQIGMSRVSGSVSNGQVTGLDVAIATPSAIASQMGRIGVPMAGPDAQIAAGVWDAPYAIANLRVRAYRVPELAPTSSWRSVGASTGGFFLETALDELILAAGADPLEERLRLCDDDIARRVLERVGEESNWGSDPGEGRGRGLALVYSFGVFVAEVVEVSNTPQGIRIDKVTVATDVGRVLDPVNFDNQVKGAVVWGLGHAMNCEVTYSDGVAQQTNYHQYQAMRMHQCPEIQVHVVDSGAAIKGIGEPPVPPAAPALGNAIYAATGQRLREMPFSKIVKFV